MRDYLMGSSGPHFGNLVLRPLEHFKKPSKALKALKGLLLRAFLQGPWGPYEALKAESFTKPYVEL